jgi:hypothetical protein
LRADAISRASRGRNLGRLACQRRGIREG